MLRSWKLPASEALSSCNNADIYRVRDACLSKRCIIESLRPVLGEMHMSHREASVSILYAKQCTSSFTMSVFRTTHSHIIFRVENARFHETSHKNQRYHLASMTGMWCSSKERLNASYFSTDSRLSFIPTQLQKLF